MEVDIHKMTENLQPPKVAFITLGCAKNEVDTERMRARVVAAGMHLVEQDSPVEQADCVVLNTCAFITEATEESINTIIELIDLPEMTSGQSRLVVTGCLPSRYGDELSSGLPEVAAFVPVSEEEQIVQIILAACGSSKQGSWSSPDIKPEALQMVTFDRIAETERPWAYLKIAEGCSRRCSYCTIPFIRGSYVPVALELLMAEADALVAAGARELVLIAQDTGLWRDDELELPDLLERLAGRFPNVWLRLMYLQPSAISDRLLAVMRKHSNICRYLDIPLQHASARVLRDMNRSGDAEEFLVLLKRIRLALPDVTLRTTVMAGFSGETRQESQELSRFLATAKFDYVGVFAYSPEAGTLAGKRSDQVPPRTRRARAQRLRDLADNIGFERAEAYVGRRLEVLVTEFEDGQPIGRLQGQAPEVDGVVYLDRGEPGQVLMVEIIDSVCYDLEARVV